MSGERKGRISFEQLGRHAWYGEESYLTVEVSFWQYHIERGALTIVEGSHTEDEAREIISKDHYKRKDEKSEKCSECPRCFQFNCRAGDLVKLAKTILETYDPNYALKE
jgi:hypothetical protein